MKKLLLLVSVMVLFVGTFLAVRALAQTGNVYHEVQIVDERGIKVTDISSVYIYAPNGTTDAVIYSDRRLQNTIVIPMTSGSDNTTLSNGKMHWYGPDGYDFSITDGTNIATNANHRTRSSSEGTLVFPSYLQSISTLTYTDAQSATWGSGSDWVSNGGNVADLMQWTPDSDNATFSIGLSGTAKNSSFNVYVDTGLGFNIDSTGPTLTWDGGIANVNVSSNFATNINTGTSTGAVNIGNSAAGAITVDTAGTASYTSDGASTITTTDAGADITLLATSGRVIITGGENASDAIIFEVDNSTASQMTFFNDTGTAADSIKFLTDVGGITGTASAGPVVFTATGATAGDVTLTAGDIMTLSHVDSLNFEGAAAETWIIEGSADDYEATVVFTNPTADITWTFPTGDADTLAVMGSTLVTNLPEAANSVTGGSNQLIFEGSSADGNETILTATNATGADATLTLPDDSGDLVYVADGGKTTKDGTNAALPLTDAIVEGTSTAASAWSLPNGENGQILTVVIVTDGGEAIITPATATGWVTAILTDDIDTITMLYVDDTAGWIVLGTAAQAGQAVALTQ